MAQNLPSCCCCQHAKSLRWSWRTIILNSDDFDRFERAVRCWPLFLTSRRGSDNSIGSYGMWRKQVEQKDTVEKTVQDASEAPPPDVSGEKLRIALTHASINSVVLGVGLWNW